MYRWVRKRYQFQLHGRRFLESPWAGGLMLMLSAIVAMFLANNSWTADFYHRLLNVDVA